MVKILIYAMGSGWGHLQRAIALANRLDGLVTILTNSTHWTDVCPGPQTVIQVCPFSRRSEIVPWINSFLSSNFDLLIVDVFPQGLFRELNLRSLTAPAILVQRSLKPSYTALIPENSLSPYWLSIAPSKVEKPPFQNKIWTIQIEPWLLCQPHQLMSKAEVKKAFGLGEKPVILVIVSGEESEAQVWGQLASQLHREVGELIAVRCVASELPPNCLPELWLRHWPAIEILPMADAVIGAAGFNLVHECQALGVPLFAIPFWKKMDNQAQRLDAEVNTMYD